MINLEDKLYTSTEVADILGVSLRSVYRYIEEDKLQAEVKTATGRHRFTRKNIMDFLYPEGGSSKQGDRNSETASQTKKTPVEEIPEEKEETKSSSKKTKKVEEELEDVEQEEEAKKPLKEAPKKVEEKESVEEEPIDWLAKFRAAAKRFDEENAKREESEVPLKETFSSISEPEQPSKKQHILYYRSKLGGLKDIAQNIDKSSRNSGLDYAFTMNAGLSLYKAIKPFSILHVYAKNRDKDFFERILMLTPSEENNSQLCLLVDDDKEIYANSQELHGLYVVEKKRLLADIREYGDSDLIEEAESILA